MFVNDLKIKPKAKQLKFGFLSSSPGNPCGKSTSGVRSINSLIAVVLCALWQLLGIIMEERKSGSSREWLFGCQIPFIIETITFFFSLSHRDKNTQKTIFVRNGSYRRRRKKSGKGAMNDVRKKVLGLIRNGVWKRDWYCFIDDVSFYSLLQLHLIKKEFGKCLVMFFT